MLLAADSASNGRENPLELVPDLSAARTAGLTMIDYLSVRSDETDFERSE